MTTPMAPVAIAMGAVQSRIDAAKKLYTAAVWEGDIEAQALHRATLHALTDQELDIMGGAIARAIKGQE